MSSTQLDIEDEIDMKTPKVEPTAAEQKEAQTPSPVITARITPMAVQVRAQREVMAIMPRDTDEAWKLAGAFVLAGMVPRSLEGKTPDETKAKVMLAICKGSEVGYAPV